MFLKCAVDVEEVRHVHDVVDDLAAIGVDDRRVPMPVRPFGTHRPLDSGNRHVRRWWLPLGVVPYEQHAVLFEGDPRRGPSDPRHSSAVGNVLAPAVATPPPVVKRAGDLVALHFSLRQVPTHVAAIGVQHVDPAVLAAEDHQPLAECVDCMRSAVTEVPRQTEAVPSAGESGRCRLSLDQPDFIDIRLQGHREPSLNRGGLVDASIQSPMMLLRWCLFR
jgi:hypothetical protein